MVANSRVVETTFDARASMHEEGRLGRWYRAQGELVLRELENVRGPVLDVGCGTGWLLRSLVHRFPNVHGVGLDLSEAMIREARERATLEGAVGVTWTRGEWEDVEARARVVRDLGGPAELVLCVSAFHYFRDPEGALRSVLDALEPGGRLLLLDRANDGSVATAVWDLAHRYVIRDGARFFRTDEMLAMLGRAGFVEAVPLRRVRRLFWKGKMNSSLVLISARKP